VLPDIQLDCRATEQMGRVQNIPPSAVDKCIAPKTVKKTRSLKWPRRRASLLRTESFFEFIGNAAL